ncbi:unnamed protein product [Vicia faba]|uniref:Reverse transcriptase zinc-binding domain-containing protein n=1 Tax=Vicia faba TaxID=3906 RepID=A0AAV0Z632_VICFA|nr:unnamed protein product [Vicia faba]
MLQRSFLWGGDEVKKKISWIGMEISKHLCLETREFICEVKCHFGGGIFVRSRDWIQNRWPIGLLLLSRANIVMVSHMRQWVDGVWVWSVRWRSCPDVRKAVAQIQELLLLLLPIQPQYSITDSFGWWRKGNGYIISNCYDCILKNESRSSELDVQLSLAWVSLRKTKVPSKIHIFGWRLIWNRLSTKSEILKCGVLRRVRNLVCPLCFGVEEDIDHLFCDCTVSKAWWNNICLCLQIDDSSFSCRFLDRLLSLEHSCKLAFVFNTGWLFGLITCWVIWKCRNDILFKELILSNIDGVGLIKLLAWDWSFLCFKIRSSLS